MKTALKCGATLLIIVFSFYKVYATHVGNADFHYEYIGDSTGISNHYKLIVTLYRTAGATNIPPAINYSVCSSCYADTQETLLLDQSFMPVQNGTNCLNTTGVTSYYGFQYSGTIILPGTCSDYLFSCSFGPRNTYIDNLSNPLDGFTIETILDNTLGDNTSPKFTSLSQMEFCVGQNATWRNPYYEPDSDSILAKLAPTLGGQECSAIQMAYSSGYTSSQPITTAPPNTAQFIGNTAFLNFTTAQIEFVVVKLVLEEYRYDSTNFTWNLIGTSIRDVALTIDQVCGPNYQSVYLSSTDTTVYFDSILNLPGLEIPCNTNNILLPFETNIDCSSISPDGSDFRLTNQSGMSMPIVSASATCSSLNLTKDIQLDIASAINTNGTYYLYTKTGNDGNTIINECGYELPEFDTILLKVTDCSGIGLDEEYLKDKIVIPNYFSPNGDGVNDVFTVHIPESFKGRFELNVTNRYGRTVYREANYSNQGWDGNLGNSPLPDGVYFCTLTWYEPNKIAPLVFKNHVTIMR